MKNQTSFKKGHKINVGRKHSDETRKKDSDAKKGKHPTEETKKKISISKKGKPSSLKGIPNPKLVEYYKNHKRIISEETRKKLSVFNWKGGRKLAKKRYNAKRKLRGYITLNETFEDCEGHHIDKQHVVFIPKVLHRSVWHSLNKPETMERINTKVFCWLLGVYCNS